MRFIKSEEELALLQRAIDITGQSQVAAMKRAAAGIYEYQLQADIEHVYKDNGARRPGFPSIVASGPNSLILHYQRNDRQIRDGELILIDIGAEYQMYTADITRTIPASGHFSDAQEEIYNHVLQAQELAMAAVKPGISLRELHAVAKTYLDSVGYGQYFIHGLSHWLGMDVHDVGDYRVGEEWRHLEASMVMTVEPGIYISPGTRGVARKWWGIGVRIEDDVLITKNGCEVLSRDVPREIADIEALMSGGI
ncbi:MAG: Xaa-Pro dipeptidase [Proteobacteria bacterium]|nr:Xaa-Pro dipeptidase [Pseudomonadota bacterium]